ncbi:uncharacterized protein [Parasteatoda tepidariorum]
MQNLENPQNLESFGSYAKSVFEKSLITSLPQIVSSKTWKKKLWKSVVFLFSLAAFLHLTQEFFAHYWTYPTESHVVESRPEEIVLPAVTFCSNNHFSREKFCNMFPFMCTDYSNDTKAFCAKFPKYCQAMYGLAFTPNKKVPVRAAFFDNWFYRQWKTAYLLNNMDLGRCDKHYSLNQAINLRCNMKHSPLLVKGYPHFCRTVEPLLGQPESKDEMINETFYYAFDFLNHPEDYFRHSDPHLLYVVVHNRRHLVNPYKKGIILKVGHQYALRVSMNEIERLPYPYDTNCTDYLAAWRRNNGTGPLNQDSCIEYCKFRKLVSEGKCIDEFTSYEPHLENLCGKNIKTTTHAMTKECVKECQPACLEQNYEVDKEVSELFAEGSMCGAQEVACRLFRTTINIYFRNFKETREIYVPKIVEIELFSFIGGYLGLWLGISIFCICDFFDSIVILFRYFLKLEKH